MQIGVESERYQKLELAEARLRAIEEQFEEIQENFFTRLNSLKDNVNKKKEHDIDIFKFIALINVVLSINELGKMASDNFF